MTELQFKLMDRADKTLSFGCIIRTTAKTYERECGVLGAKYIDKTIGHPYGFERLERLRITLLGVDGVNREMKYIYEYIEKNNFDPLLKKCIDRPEEGQQLVLDFLQTLPKGN